MDLERRRSVCQRGRCDYRFYVRGVLTRSSMFSLLRNWEDSIHFDTAERRGRAFFLSTSGSALPIEFHRHASVSKEFARLGVEKFSTPTVFLCVRLRSRNETQKPDTSSVHWKKFTKSWYIFIWIVLSKYLFTINQYLLNKQNNS